MSKLMSSLQAAKGVIKLGGNVLNVEKGSFSSRSAPKARKKRRRPALVVQVLDQSQRLQNLTENERERGRKVAMTGESVSTMERRATGRGISLNTWL